MIGLSILRVPKLYDVYYGINHALMYDVIIGTREIQLHNNASKLAIL
jgi:hypothetical protein